MGGAGKEDVTSLRESEDGGRAMGDSVEAKEPVDQDSWEAGKELSNSGKSESAPQKSAGKSEVVKACSLLSKSN